MSTFGLDLQKFADSADKTVNLVTRKIILDLDASLVYKSPVGDPEYWAVDATASRYNSEAREVGSSDRIGQRKAPPGYVGGRFRGNWQYGLGSINGKTTTDVDADGGASIERVAGQLDAVVAGKKHYLTNSLAYAKRLEEGWSRQAPNGMVALTVIEFQPIVIAAAKALHL